MVNVGIVPVKPAKPENSLDVVKLEQMVEPLTVIIEKMKNGLRMPIPLPIGDSGQAGVGWSKEEVQAIQQGWLVNEWSGGGMYAITVTDDTKPAPLRLSWQPFWPVSEYPEKIPPTLAGSAAPARMQQPQQPQPQVFQPMSQFPGGLPTGGIMMSQPQYPQPQQSPYLPYAQMQPQQQNPYAMQLAQAEADRRRMEEMLAKTQADLQQSRLDTMQRQHAADLDAERQKNSMAVTRLEQQIAAMATQMSQAQTQSAKNPEIEQLREAQRLSEAKYENERRERDAERREQMLREQIAAMASNTAKQIDALQQNYAAQMVAMNANKSDPMMAMMAEQNRNFIAALGEVSRQSTSQIEKFQAFMMSPKDIMEMQKGASSGLDQLTNKFAGVYTNVMDMQQRVIENAMNLNQGGSETIGLIKEGIGTAKEAFERYVAVRGKTEQTTQNAQAAAIQAQAQAQAIQAQAQVAIHQMQNQPPAPPAPAPAVTPRPSPGLNGVPQAPNGKAQFEEFQRQRAQNGVAAQPQVGQPDTAVNAQGVPPPITAPLRRGRTDDQWFGPFAGEVASVRHGVVMFLDGLKKNPPEFVEGTADPMAVATGILQAQSVVVTQNIPIPAMVELLNQGHYAEFLEVLIPDAPPEYRADVVTILRQKLDGELPEEDGDEDDDEDDGEGPHDDVQDGQVDPPKKSPIRIVVPARPARA